MKRKRRQKRQTPTLADELKLSFMILNKQTQMTREQFSEQYTAGGLATIRELVALFGEDPNFGARFVPDPALARNREKEMLKHFNE